jgi:hypothetical protein
VRPPYRARPDSRMRPPGGGQDGAVGTVDASGYNYSQFRRHHLVEEVAGAVSLRGVRPGAPAPDFELPRVGGGTLALAALHDRPTLLHFGSFT